MISDFSVTRGVSWLVLDKFIKAKARSNFRALLPARKIHEQGRNETIIPRNPAYRLLRIRAHAKVARIKDLSWKRRLKRDPLLSKPTFFRSRNNWRNSRDLLPLGGCEQKNTGIRGKFNCFGISMILLRGVVSSNLEVNR